MDVQLEPGEYVAAVSGGVDSVALLHILRAKPGVRLVVAHFDHGMRQDSAEDRLFVEALAKAYDLPFVYAEGRLGAGASEASAREARYDFLRKVRQANESKAIITAHHQDDVLETAIINILRGSGRKGLSSLGSQNDLERPLLRISKRELVNYAKDQGLQWREDSTNQDQAYLRNYVRHRLLSRFDEQSRDRLGAIIEQSRETNQELDNLLASQLQFQPEAGSLDRQWFNQLPHAVAKEIMASWLRAHNIRNFDKKGLERLVVAAKVGHPGSQFDVSGGTVLRVGNNRLALTNTER